MMGFEGSDECVEKADARNLMGYFPVCSLLWKFSASHLIGIDS